MSKSTVFSAARNPSLLEALKTAEGDGEFKAAQELKEKMDMLKDIEKHYKKKEELLFPYLEKNR
jgi:hypothetical protein